MLCVGFESCFEINQLSEGRNWTGRSGIRYDPLSPSRARLDHSSEDDVVYFLFFGGGGAFLFFAWLSWGVWVNKRRERRGWGTGSYTN